MKDSSPETIGAAAELFKAMANPRRLAILLRLSEERACVHDLVRRLDLPQPLVSQHIRVLRTARLIRGERRGREIVYSLADHHVAHIASDALTHVAEEDALRPTGTHT
ncbi:MAG: transcriptional regulator [Gemmatimonadetes bacterium]|nr:transcriptional regulator [Gemmatimonadota bacterium]